MARSRDGAYPAAVDQLAPCPVSPNAISFILGGVITSPLWVAGALLVMFAVAAMSATRRTRTSSDAALTGRGFS